MASTRSSADVDAVISLLAKKAVYNAEARRGTIKTADLPTALRSFGSSALDTLRQSPTLGAGLLGAGLGGAYGLATNYARPEEERRPIGSALSGAMAGGALGIGAGLAGHQLGKLRQEQAATSSPPENQFTHGGRAYTLSDPGAAEKLLPELQKLESRSPITRGVGAISDAISGYAKSHPLLAMILAGDVGSHALGTAAEMTNAGRGAGATLGHFNRGLKKLKDEGSQFTKEQIGAIKTWAGEQSPESFHANYQDAIRNNRPITRIAPAVGKGTPKTQTIMPQELRNIARLGTGSVRAGGPRALLDVLQSILPEKYRIGNNLTGTGLGGEAKGIAAILERLGLGKSNAKAVGNAGQSLLQRAHTFQRPSGLVGRLAPRVGLYAGLPALQWYLGQAATESEARNRINELLQQHAKPVN